MALQESLGLSGGDVDGNFGPGTRTALLENRGFNANAIRAKPGDLTHWISPNEDGFWPAD